MTTWLKHLEINYPEIYKRLDFHLVICKSKYKDKRCIGSSR